MNKSRTVEWEQWPEAFRLFLNGATFRACLPIAIIVGLLLSTINQGDVIISGMISGVVWIKIGMNFVVPFCVSSYGFLNGCRVEIKR